MTKNIIEEHELPDIISALTRVTGMKCGFGRHCPDRKKSLSDSCEIFKNSCR